MKRLQQVLVVCFCIYFLYEVKSALGIDISPQYHAIDLIRIPVKYVVHKFTG